MNRIGIGCFRPDFQPRENKAVSPPDIINEEEEFEVEAILDVKYKKASKDAIRKGFTSGVWYLVQWKGYSPTENTWTQKDNVENADELITEFHHTHPDKLDEKGRKPNKKTLTRKLEIPMSSFPRQLLCPMPPLNDTEDVNEDLPSEKKLLQLVIQNRDQRVWESTPSEGVIS